MENSTFKCPCQSHFDRLAQEIKDALRAMRAAESALQFEFEARRLERVVWELESWEGNPGA